VVDPSYFSVACPGAWPTLNNTPPDDRAYADRVHLLDGDGTVLDHATVGWAGAAVPSGRSVERSGLLPAGHDLGLWRTCTASAGSTPGCANALEAPVPTDQPLVVTRDDGGDAVLLSFELNVNESAWRLEIYDLTGMKIRDLGGDALGPGPRRIAWDGRDDRDRATSRDARIALLTVAGPDGAPLRRHRALVVSGCGAGP
jgi:hypothetical protein